MEVKLSKNTLTAGLMISSIVLLLILQFFWLRSAYIQAGENFRRETNSLFRNTVFAMHDSLIRKSLQPISSDSTINPMDINRIIVRKHGGPILREDSSLNYINISEHNTRIEIISTEKKDSIGKILRPLITKIKDDKAPKTFVLKLGSDTLSVDSIEQQYRRTLNLAGIDAEFEVVMTNRPPPPMIRENVTISITNDESRFVSEPVHVNPLTEYKVAFAGVEGLLIREITPQILFSIFLTTLTVASFYIMHRNLKAQQRLVEIKNDFISNVTHELKTPVTTVSVTLEALRNFNVLKNPKLSHEYLEIAERELRRLNEITDRILKTSVLEKEITITNETTRLDKITEQVLRDMNILLSQRNAKVDFKKNGNDFSLHCDGYPLYQLVENLIDNALKYSNHEPHIELSVDGSEKEVVFSVRDYGIGISEEYHDKIFEKFFRVPSGDVQTIKGYGLGLSYVYNLVKSLGGEIAIKSEPMKGSLFVLKFPRIKVKV